MFDIIVSFWLMQSPVGGGCTFDNPQPVGINRICTGLGNPGASCKLSYKTNCSPIPGEPGTWNPSGYTPKIG